MPTKRRQRRRGPGKDELSRTLFALREAAHLTGEDVAASAGFSQAKVSRIEGGVNVPSPKDVITLARVYGAPADTRDRLVQLAEDMKAGSRRVVLNRGGTEFQARLARIEEASEHVRSFTATVVPGLLQTEDYARALYRTGDLSEQEIEAAVRGRMERQALLGIEGHRFTLLTTAGALSWCAGSPAVMATQADRLATPQPTGVHLGVIPWGRPVNCFPMHNWDMYDQRGVTIGLVSSTALLTNRLDVEMYDQWFAKLEELAVWDDEARAELRRIADEYRRLSGN
jgi:transcriptional regulator with XRE-family HTH domain